MCKLIIKSNDGAEIQLTGDAAESYAEEWHRLYGFNVRETGQKVVVTDLVTTVTDGDGSVHMSM